MTQVSFATLENPVTSAKLNTAVQGHRFLRRSIYAGLSEPAIHKCHARASTFFSRLIGPGGGGGGAPAGAASDAAAGSGGAAGGYAEKVVSSAGILRLDLLILAPQGGAGAIAGASPGSAAASGAAILYNVGGINYFTLVSAIPGAGGNWMNAGASLFFMPGGLGGFGFLGDVNINGEAGGFAIRFGGTAAVSGRGARSIYGGGGSERTFPQTGDTGGSYGAGGSGGQTVGVTPMGGGSGGDAAVIIDEYH